MCPDTELLSAYYDEELDHVWEDRIGGHVATCSICQQKLARFARLTDELATVDGLDLKASMERSWQAIEAARHIRKVKLWQKRISIPVPVLAAAAAVLIGLFGVGLFFSLSAGPVQQTAPPVAVQQPEIAPVDFQVNNLSELLNYLNSKDLAASVTIQLPKGVDQLSVGKPQLIRAADFNRGQ